MKTLLYITLIMSFVLAINAQYTSKPEEVQLGVPKILQTIKKGEFTYSVQQMPTKIIKNDIEEDDYFIESVYSILVKKKNDVIQEFKMENEIDLLTISFEKKFFYSVFKTLLKVKHEWNNYFEEFGGYIGYALYTLDASGKITTKVFSWIQTSGIDDDPSAQLKEFSIFKNSIAINYYYYEEAGYPEFGNGIFTVTYTLNKANKNIEFSRIDNQVYRKVRMIKKIKYNKYITAPVIPPELVPLDKDILNEKFRDALKVYNFLF